MSCPIFYFKKYSSGLFHQVFLKSNYFYFFCKNEFSMCKPQKIKSLVHRSIQPKALKKEGIKGESTRAPKVHFPVFFSFLFLPIRISSGTLFQYLPLKKEESPRMSNSTNGSSRGPLGSLSHFPHAALMRDDPAALAVAAAISAAASTVLNSFIVVQIMR